MPNGADTYEALAQFLLIHDKLCEVQLQHDMPDEVTRRWASDGLYSATSAYDM
jgi:hypothetical protein